MTLHDPVEIKVTLSDAVPDAMDTLHLDNGSPLRIWFLDDLTSGLRQPLPLLAAGVILRLRAKADEDDSTVKLRPCRRSQLAPRWATNDKQGKWEHRIEGDQSGTRRVLAASSVLTLPSGRIAQATAAGADRADLGAAFDARQLEFLGQCADLRVNPSGLTALGPIAATKWKDVKLRIGPNGDDNNNLTDDNLKVDAERWTVAGMDFLELSIRVKADADPEAAHSAQAAFEAAVRGRGLTFEALQTPKTEQVLKALASVLDPG